MALLSLDEINQAFLRDTTPKSSDANTVSRADQSASVIDQTDYSAGKPRSPAGETDSEEPAVSTFAPSTASPFIRKADAVAGESAPVADKPASVTYKPAPYSGKLALPPA
jgi:hypothetical protein